jgi:hypothetical protein
VTRELIDELCNLRYERTGIKFSDADKQLMRMTNTEDELCQAVIDIENKYEIN